MWSGHLAPHRLYQNRHLVITDHTMFFGICVNRPNLTISCPKRGERGRVALRTRVWGCSLNIMFLKEALSCCASCFAPIPLINAFQQRQTTLLFVPSSDKPNSDLVLSTIPLDHLNYFEPRHKPWFIRYNRAFNTIESFLQLTHNKPESIVTTAVTNSFYAQRQTPFIASQISIPQLPSTSPAWYLYSNSLL